MNYWKGRGGVEINEEEAFKWMEKSSSQSLEGKVQLALFYMNGVGIERSADVAFQLFVESAERGSRSAKDIIFTHFFSLHETLDSHVCQLVALLRLNTLVHIKFC